MARKPVQPTPMLPSHVPDEPNRSHLVDLDRQLRVHFVDLGEALNDDLITISDWTRALAFADSPYAMLDTDRFLIVDSTAGVVVVNLPAAANMEPHLVGIKKTVAANSITVNANGSDLIDGAASKSVSGQWDLLLLLSDKASAWHILHTGAP